MGLFLPQNYSMDCYFRQYWRDERLSFTGLKKDAHSDRDKIDKAREGIGTDSANRHVHNSNFPTKEFSLETADSNLA